MTDRLREAPEKLHHAVCGETGFAAAVRQESGKAYPWPALDIADDLARAALAAAPQPAPDREALVEVIDNALRDWSNLPPLTCLRASYVADALLARGLRLPGDETMAWAVVGEDGQINPDYTYQHKEDAEYDCTGAEIVRVAIRVVEGGDDE